ncbi:MAG TPA: hypothetical protein DCY03_29895 [Planctomycetaceae bacterium]|nr:hypothetical protein [Planctomycetaceae bacterium]|tara:strand:- start:272 stop:841 length:570 start_codon:yes stop_codon:yes gene_type:complete
MSDTKPLTQFVESFARMEDMFAPEGVPDELLVKAESETWESWQEFPRWQPLPVETDPADLDPLYQRIGGTFPPLYEQLLLSFRWLEVDLKLLRLFANPPGDNFAGLSEAIFADRALAEVLIPAGYVPFGRSSVNYDPICFDLNARLRTGDCPVIQFKHEAILCELRIGEQWQRWASFRDLMSEVVLLDS